MDEYERLTAYGTQLILTHARLRDMLDDLVDGKADGIEDLTTHCIAFCDALTEHHTDEDDNVFPVLAARHPELRDFLTQLRQDHAIIAGLVRGVRQDDPEALSALAAVMETHFRGEEKRLITVLNEIRG
jgi:hemerythrin HHE cation binding domain-containing protein